LKKNQKSRKLLPAKGGLGKDNFWFKKAYELFTLFLNYYIDQEMKEYTTRSASIKDLDALLDFEQGVITAERPFDPTIRKGSIRYYDLEELILSEEAEVIVIEYQNMIVASGYALIKKARHYLDHEEYSYLGFMYTHPDFRGRGLNKMVVDALSKWSEARGISEIRLTVYNDNAPAIKAYEKVGFKKHIIEMRIAK